MDKIMILYLLFWGAILGLLIYFLLQRIETKKKEDFDQRDN